MSISVTFKSYFNMHLSGDNCPKIYLEVGKCTISKRPNQNMQTFSNLLVSYRSQKENDV